MRRILVSAGLAALAPLAVVRAQNALSFFDTHSLGSV